MNYGPYIDRLFQFFSEPPYQEEVIEAKKEFFGYLGTQDDDSARFEVRMSQFGSWYLFTRELNREKTTPAQFVSHAKNFAIKDEERPLFENLAACRHSLFEFHGLRGSDVFMRDLISGKKLVARDSHITVGFNAEEIFEAWLIPHKDNFVFTSGFCFHPAGSKKYIVQEIKRVKGQESAVHEALMFRLLKMRYKFDQYRHVRLDYIYCNDPKLKVEES